ncbi:uncharacterized protein [Montipora capricornis]|uniref:uncharacterized protein n=1 Tax=Montipora capricornis TaxID=246305 RepID=UPI0035F10751
MEDNTSNCTASVGPSTARNMEWTDAHDIQLAREVLVSEPFRFKPRTVERGKVWQEIANRLNENRLIHFRVTKRSTREHFSLLLEKFKAKRKNEAKQSGVDVQDSELDVAMEEIWEKWQEAESQDATCDMNKKQMEADKASGEEVRRKACEKLGETSKRKMEEEAAEVKPRKSRRYGSDTIEFLREKAKQDLAIRKEEVQRKVREEERHGRLQEQFLLAQQQQQQHQMQMLNMMQQQNRAIIELMGKFTSPK